MTVELMTITPDAERLIETAGRVCYDSGAKITETSHVAMIKYLLKGGHHSVLEHAGASFMVDGVSRALTHQLVRSRIASFSQRSQRYVNEGGFEYVVPPSIIESQKSDAIGVSARLRFETLMERIQTDYEELIALGIPKEDARFVLPNACTSQIFVTMNFREFLHTIDLRVSLHAQWEIREMFRRIWETLIVSAPTVFGPEFFEHHGVEDFEYKKKILDGFSPPL